MDVARLLQEQGPSILNEYLVSEPSSGAEQGNSLLIAAEQVDGRGRGENAWYSAADGGLYMSLLLFPKVTPQSLLGVSLLAGLSVCKALRNCGAECGIKWPNDVVVSGTEETASQKLSGILVESSIQGESTKSLIIGIGVNVAQENFPSELKAISIKQLIGVEFELSRVLTEILEHFEKDYSRFLAEGFEVFIPQWSEHSVLLGSQVKINVNYEGGFSAPLEGRVVNLKSDGALLVEEAPGKAPVEVYSGEFIEIRSGITSGVSVRQALEQLVSEVDDEQLAKELKEDFDSAGSITKEMLMEDQSDSSNLAGLIREMKLGEKMKLGMLGSMTARALLIRDTNRLVRAAVMRNPRLSDNEIVEFARNANMEEQVLRLIAKNKSWMKIYPIKVGIVSNPKTPLDISVRWLKHLKDKELRILSKSKNVPSALVNQCRKLIELRTKK
jgi:biotin-[acetyl-CoA-carboxylase] ligase BirA-like protein